MLKALFILVVGTLVASALATPWIYYGLFLLMGEDVWPYSRVFNRVCMLMAFILLLFLRRHFPLREAIAYLKNEPWSVAWRRVVLGIAITVSSVVCAVPLLVFWTGDLIWDPEELSEFAEDAGKILFGALLIGIIEECFFRVLVLNALRRKFSTVTAVIACSLLYAVVHFIAPIKSWSYETFSWDIGLVYLGKVFEQFFHPSVPSSFFGLVLVGIILSMVIIKFKSLYLCIGLHAGWVISVKGIKLLGEFNPALGIPSGRISQYFLVSLPIAWASILCVGLFLWVIQSSVAVAKVPEAV